ncbi:MAG: hypothetical protein A2Y21_02120 [Clostridiales bacterium GWC2_40_7]|nr:MAG: hypothetical protein A2Y21_02120 [Clostridiales bacterium GWC2_40_7]
MKLKYNSPEDWMLGMSTCAFSELSFESLKKCSEAGVNCIELGFTNEGFEAISENGRKYLGKIAGLVRQNGLTLWSGHMPYFGNWSIDTPDNEIRTRSVKNCCELLEMGAGVGMSKMVIHPSSEIQDHEDRDLHMKFSKESLCILNEKAKCLQIQLAVEVLPRSCLANTSTEMLKLIAGIEGVGICCDMNHLLQESAVEFIKKTGNRIVTTHVSDYDGIDERHWLPGKGINNWQEIVHVLVNAGYTGPFMYEVRNIQDTGPITALDIVENWNAILQSSK